MPRLAARAVLAALILVTAGTRAAAKAPPERASVGLYLISLSGINPGAGTCAADFWLWSNTRSANLEPPERLDIVNEVEIEREPLGTARFGDVCWDQRRVRVTARSDWNVRHFPLEHQRLEIRFEDSCASADELVLEADKVNSRLDPALHLPGWIVVGDLVHGAVGVSAGAGVLLGGLIGYYVYVNYIDKQDGSAARRINALAGEAKLYLIAASDSLLELSANILSSKLPSR